MRFQLFCFGVAIALAICLECLAGCSPVERPNVQLAVAEARERINEDTPSEIASPSPTEAIDNPLSGSMPAGAVASVSPDCCCDDCRCNPCRCGLQEQTPTVDDDNSRRDEIVASPEPESTEPEGVSTGVKTESEAVGPVVELIAFSAEWCGPCVEVHEAAEGVEGVRFIDIEAEPEETDRLWPSNYFENERGGPTSLPAFAKVVDGETVQAWIVPRFDKPITTKRIELMRDYDGPRLTTASKPSPVIPSGPVIYYEQPRPFFQFFQPRFLQRSNCGPGGCR